MTKYRVAYPAAGWQPRTYRRGPLAPRRPTTDEFQVVQHLLPNGWRLYVELARGPQAPLRVLVARLDRPCVRCGQLRYLVTCFLGVEDLELIEVPATDRA